jgi:Type VI secretion, TssG
LLIPATIQQELQELNADIRAEVIVDQLLQAGISREDIMVHANSFFYRRFSRDVFSTDIQEDNEFKQILHINTSRAGLYDILPEGLFFQPAQTGSTPISAADMAEEYRVNKKQELAVRKFFSPLENEFFFHGHRNFATEKYLLTGLNNEAINRYFIKFWKMAADMPAAMALRITLLLPYVHRVTGHPDLMAACLQAILNEEVRCNITSESSQAPDLFYNILGQFDLGNDFVCGDSYLEAETCFVFTLCGLQQSAAQDYLPGGQFSETLQTFYRFFVPANAAIKTVIQLKASKAHMQIGDMEAATLGIATVI